MFRLRSVIFCLSLVAFVSVFCCEFKSPTIVGYSDGYLGIRTFYKANNTRSCINYNVNVRDGAESLCVLNTVVGGSQKFYTKSFKGPLELRDTVYYKLSYEEKDGKKCESEMTELKLNSLAEVGLKEDL